jgi:hypothetical protein
MIKSWIIKNLRLVADVAFRPQFSEIVEEIRREAIAMQYLAPLNTSYVPWSRASLMPSAIATILNDIIINQRKTVLEFGGGISTIYIARLLAKQKRLIHFISVEHDVEWLKTLQDILQDEGILDYVHFVCAPLTDEKYSLRNDLCATAWYDKVPILDALYSEKVDLLVVDGPNPTPGNLYSRYPALPVLINHMSSSYMVLLDDSGRRGEREIIVCWESLSGVSFKKIGKYSIGFCNTHYKPFV